MFDQVFEGMRKATEASVQMQQEGFKKWLSLWPGVPAAAPLWGEQVLRLQEVRQKWAEVVHDLLRRQREMTEASFKAGLQNIEKAFQLAEARNAEELRARTMERWRQCFESLRQASEAPLHEFQAATERWLELMGKAAA